MDDLELLEYELGKIREEIEAMPEELNVMMLDALKDKPKDLQEATCAAVLKVCDMLREVADQMSIRVESVKRSLKTVKK